MKIVGGEGLEGLLEALGGMGDDQRKYGPEVAAPKPVLELMGPFSKVLNEREALIKALKRVDNKLNYLKDGLVEAIHESFPGTDNREFRWDAHKGTVRFVLPEDAPDAPDWVKDIVADDDGQPIAH